MRKLVLFALFCVSIFLLLPMVSSVETKLVNDEIKNKINSNFIEITLLSNFLYKLTNFSNIILLFIKALCR